MRICRSCGNDLKSDEWECQNCGYSPIDLDGIKSFVDDPNLSQPAEFDEATFRQMTSFEQTSFYIRSRFDLMYWCFSRFFPGTSSFFDFGGGTGFWLQSLATKHPDIRLVGSDLSQSSIQSIRRRLGDKAEVIHTDSDNIPFRDEFDVVGSFDVIEHIDDDLDVLRRLYSAVRPGGGVMITVPQHMCLWSVLDDKTGHKRRYVGNELARKVSDAGFDVILDTGFMAFLFVPQYISRRFMNQSADSDSEMEHQLPSWLNAIFRTALVIELACIRMGMRFGFGGLRIVAAKKPIRDNPS